MRKALLIFTFILSIQTSFAGNENYPVGARQAGMAGIGVCLSDIWSVYHNQAALADLEHITASAYYENKFLVSEMGLQGAAIAVPTKTGVFGASFTRFGYSQYNESKYGLAFGKSFGDNFSAGVQLNYLNTRIGEGYGSKGSFTVEMGIRAKLLRNLMIGFHAYNLTRAKLTDFNNERIPTVLKLGLQYTFSEKVFIGLEAEKDIDHDPIFKAGVEYHVVKAFYLRAGVATNPYIYSFGLGLDINEKFKVDIASNIHPVLGVSPQASLSYVFK